MKEKENLEKAITEAIRAGMNIDDIIKVVKKFDERKSNKITASISQEEINFLTSSFQRSS